MACATLKSIHERKARVGGIVCRQQTSSRSSICSMKQKPEGLQPKKRCSCVVVVFLISGRWIPQSGDPGLRIRDTTAAVERL
eukprot:1925500-Rhodomonas_salina.1